MGKQACEHGHVATVVAFHAHPDDEVLLTGGTLARLAAEGHRVVIVTATDGVVHAVADAAAAQARLDELRAAAAVLGAARVVHLGYADSGHGSVLYPDPPGRVRFARADLEEAAGRLAALLREESADLLLSYDADGGYGHRDHVRVHQVGARAAALGGTARVLEATFPREPAAGAARLLAAARLRPLHEWEHARRFGTPRAAVTHQIDVRRYAARKRAALACHASQRSGRGRSARAFRLLAALPVPVFGLLLGREWFAEPGAAPGRAHHIL